MWQATDPSYYHADLIPIHPIHQPVGKDCSLLTSHLPAGTSALAPPQSHRMLNIPAGAVDGGLFMVPYHALPANLPLMVQPTLPQTPLKVNWATTQGSRKDTTHHHHVFVGDLVQDMKTPELRALFDKFGSITDARVVRDPETGKSRCYGFVSFEHEEDAQLAIKEMNGAILPQYPGMKAIRTGWATRKPTSHKTPTIEAKDYDKVLNETSPNNCTVYVGGLQFKFTGSAESVLRKVFGPFGEIQEVRTFPEKAFAFVRFSNHESATNAIVSVHGSTIEGHVVKCSWGKESSDSSNFQQSQAQSQQMQLQQGVGQFYGQQQPQQQQGYNQFGQYGYQQYPVGGQQYVMPGVPQNQQYGYYQNPGVVMQGGYVGGYNGGGGGGGGGGSQGGYMMQPQQGASAALYPNSTQSGYMQPGYQ